MAENKLQYALSCDRLRVNDEGDLIWHTLMEKAERITFEEFEDVCDLGGLLDEGETLGEYVSIDDWAGAYKVETDGEPVVFMQRAGFEFFFTHDGLPPTYVEELDPLANEVMIENGVGKVLLKPNDARIGGAYGFEGELEYLDHDMDCVISQCPRFRLYRDERVVAGLRIENGVVDSMYVARDYRRQGLATELFNRAQEIYGGIEHSTSLTDDGRKFRDSFLDQPEDDRQDSYDEGPSL